MRVTVHLSQNDSRKFSNQIHKVFVVMVIAIRSLEKRSERVSLEESRRDVRQNNNSSHISNRFFESRSDPPKLLTNVELRVVRLVVEVRVQGQEGQLRSFVFVLVESASLIQHNYINYILIEPK